AKITKEAVELNPVWLVEDPTLAAELPVRPRMVKESWDFRSGDLRHCYEVSAVGSEASLAKEALVRRGARGTDVNWALQREDSRLYAYLHVEGFFSGCWRYPKTA